MKNKKVFLLIYLSIFGALIFSMVSGDNNIINDLSLQEILPKSSQNGLQEVDPIFIESSSDWENYPFITGNGSETDPYIIENLYIEGLGDQFPMDYDSISGIRISYNAYIVIQNCTIVNFAFGIYYQGGNEDVKIIDSNTIRSCGIGIYIGPFTSNFIISNCIIEDCKKENLGFVYPVNNVIDSCGFGIFIFYFQTYGRIEGCQIKDCDIGISISSPISLVDNHLVNCGISVGYRRGELNFEGNTVNNKTVLYYFEVNSTIIDGNQEEIGQLLIFYCENITICNLDMTGQATLGLYLQNCNNITIDHCRIADRLYGVSLRVSNSIIHDLLIENCTFGLFSSLIEDSNLTQIQFRNNINDFIGTSFSNAQMEVNEGTKMIIFSYVYLYMNDDFYNSTFDDDWGGNLIQLPAFERGFYEIKIYWISSTEMQGNINITVSKWKRVSWDKIIPGFSMESMLTSSLIAICGIYYYIIRKRKKI